MEVEQRYEISANFIRFSSKFKISIFTSASSDRSAGAGAKNRNEARSEPKNGLYYVKGKLYDGTLKMLRYSAQDLYGVNAIGMVYPRLRPLPPHAYTRDRRAGRYGGAISRLF